jgi:glucose-6-phosphate-specific signal transduction histidine kinase
MALTNAAKHARATAGDIEAAQAEGALGVRVRANGHGGADFSDGSGLLGLRDRAEALGGRLRLRSPPGARAALSGRSRAACWYQRRARPPGPSSNHTPMQHAAHYFRGVLG